MLKNYYKLGFQFSSLYLAIFLPLSLLAFDGVGVSLVSFNYQLDFAVQYQRTAEGRYLPDEYYSFTNKASSGAEATPVMGYALSIKSKPKVGSNFYFADYAFDYAPLQKVKLYYAGTSNLGEFDFIFSYYAVGLNIGFQLPITENLRIAKLGYGLGGSLFEYQFLSEKRSQAIPAYGSTFTLLEYVGDIFGVIIYQTSSFKTSDNYIDSLDGASYSASGSYNQAIVQGNIIANSVRLIDLAFYW